MERALRAFFNSQLATPATFITLQQRRIDMSCGRLTFAFAVFIAFFTQIGWAQSAGGLVSATTSVRYTPVVFPKLVQLTDFNPVTIALSGSDANGDSLMLVLASGPSLGAVGVIDPVAGTITYSPPTGFSTTDSFTFSVTDGVLSSETATVTVFAPQPAANLSAASLDFGSQLDGTKSLLKTLTLSNTSVASLNVSSIAISGPSASDFTIESSGNCPRSGAVAAGATCTLALSFTPAAIGVRQATMAITDDSFDSPQTVTLAGAGTDYFFGPTPGGSTSATVSAGQTATYNLQINSANGFAGLVGLTCGGAPLRSTCAVNPAQVNVNGVPATFSVSVTTTAPANAQAALPLASDAPLYYAGFTLLATALIFGLHLTSNRSRSARTLCHAVLVGIVLFVCSCGGGNGPQPPIGQPGTPVGTYVLSVAGSVNSATRSTTLTLIVR
jgi:hypothetical protein